MSASDKSMQLMSCDQPQRDEAQVSVWPVENRGGNINQELPSTAKIDDHYGDVAQKRREKEMLQSPLHV